MLLDKIVLGSNIESLLYAFLNDCFFISTRKSPLLFYRGLSLSLFGKKSEIEVWPKLLFTHSLLGKNINSESFDRISIRDSEISISFGNHIKKYCFEKCFIFDPTNIDHECNLSSTKQDTYLVLDDFEVSRLGGMPKELPPFESYTDPIRKINFYTSDRILGAKYVTDCVVESLLTKQQINTFDYSDSMVRFVLKRYLTSIGINGKFMKINKNGSIKYRKPKITHVRRLVYMEDNNLYSDNDNIIFLNMSLEDIINEVSTKRPSSGGNSTPFRKSK